MRIESLVPCEECGQPCEPTGYCEADGVGFSVGVCDQHDGNTATVPPFPNSDGELISVEEYAEMLFQLVYDEMKIDAELGEAVCWGDLHDHVDANDFLIEADTLYGIRPDASNRGAHLQFLNAAVRIAEGLLWPSTTDGEVAR